MEKIVEMLETIRPMMEAAKHQLKEDDLAKLERTYRYLEEILWQYRHDQLEAVTPQLNEQSE